MRRILVLLVALLATSLVDVRPSRAQYDCTDEYIRSFDVPAHGGAPAWSAGRIQCHPYFEVEIDTPRGYITVRGIGDENVGILLPSDGIRSIERGVERVRDRVGELGDFDLYNTTILISSRPRSSVSEAQPEGGYASAWSDLGSDRARSAAECHITLFINREFSPEDIHYTVAHEMFHCIQKARGTLSAEQNATASGFGLWWIEGSAEWFAAWVVGPRPAWPRGAELDSAVNAGTPVYEMSYKAAPFFYWFDETFGGPRSIIPFLRGMADSGTAEAQQAAMRRMLPPAQWLNFVKAYDDREIHYPDGGLVGFTQRVDGVTWNISETTDHLRPLAPFVIAVGWANYACGLWANTVADANVQVRAEDANVWTPWPDEIDIRGAPGGGGRRHRMVGIVVEPGGPVDFTLSAVRREACTVCLTRSVVDACVVGRWRQTGGGPLEYLRRNGVPITMANQTTLVITMRDDGTFTTNSIETGVETETTDSHGHVLRGMSNSDTRAVTGRWSAADGALMGCIDSGGERDGVTVLEAEGHYRTMPMSGGSMAGFGGQSTYTCSDTTLTTSAPTAHGAMTYEFTRETPTPRRR